MKLGGAVFELAKTPVRQGITRFLDGPSFRRGGTFQVDGSAAVSRVEVSAAGRGVVPHAGVGMVREPADLTGLSSQVDAAFADTYKSPWVHAWTSPVSCGATASMPSGRWPSATTGVVVR